MASSSKNYDDNTAGLWRSAAKYKVVYTEDFPAALLTATEFSDNSLAKGRATKIDWTFDITNPQAGIFTIRDNGVGIEGQSDLIRFCTIGSKDSSDAHHRYAQGRVSALASLMPDYETAKWTATFKFDGHTTMLNQISQPWSTCEKMQRSMVKIPIDETNRALGFELKITFDTSILGEELAADPRKLFAKTKERLTSKYTERVFEKTEFVLTVKNATQNITESSCTNNWKTLEQMLHGLPASSCETVFDHTFQWKSISVTVTEYNLCSFKSKEPAALVDLRTAFPTFGTRSIPATRVHIFNDDRLIESRPKSGMDCRVGHNSQNGDIVFIKTDSSCGDFNDQPEPSTIKVSIVDKCENLDGIYKLYRDEKKRRTEEAKMIAAAAAKEKAAKEKATRAAKEKAEKELKEKAALQEIAKKIAASSKSKHEPKIVPTAGGGVGVPMIQKISTDTDEPVSPSMPELQRIPSFPSITTTSFPSITTTSFPSITTTSFPSITTTSPKLIIHPKPHYTMADMKELLQMSLTLMSPETATILKIQVRDKYGFEDDI
jgi:hypothetical protein